MISYREVKDRPEAEAIWRALSPHKTIFDDWDFRACFYKYEPHPLCFIVAYDDSAASSSAAHHSAEGELVGLLPLQKHPNHGYEFFAEDPCEENRPFVKPGYERIIPGLYAAIPGPAKCFDITGDDEFTSRLPLEDYKYVLPLADLKNFSDFLERRLSSKRRRSLIKELAAVESGEVAVVIGDRRPRSADLELLFSLNHKNFAGDSYLQEEAREPWRDLLRLPYDWRLLVLKIKGVSEAVSLSVLYQKEWHYLITGVNYQAWPGLGKYLVKANIEAAIASGAKVFDAGLGDCGWKHLWHFDRQPQYELTRQASGRIVMAKS